MKKLRIPTLCIILAALFLTGCSAKEEKFEKKSNTFDTSKITAVQIDVKNRKIELEPSEDGQIHLTYYENDKEFYEITQTEDHTLVIRSANSKDWADYIGEAPSQESRTIRIQLPKNGLSSLRLATSNEDVLLPNFSFSDSVSITNNKGNIQLEKLQVGKTIGLEVKDGDITGTIVGGYDDFSINCKVKKGKSNLPEIKEDGAKSLSVTANNGDIDIRFEKDTTGSALD